MCLPWALHFEDRGASHQAFLNVWRTSHAYPTEKPYVGVHINELNVFKNG